MIFTQYWLEVYFKRAIQKIEKNIEQKELKMKRNSEECENLKEIWLSQIEAVVHEVTNRITEYFGKIKCKGRVAKLKS